MKDIPEIIFNTDRGQQTKGFEFIVLDDFVGHLKDGLKQNHNPFKAHRLKFNIILIINSGKVCHSVDFEDHNLQAGDIMVISKGQIHAFDANSDYKGYILLFTDEFMHKYMAKSTIVQINNLYNSFLGQRKMNNPDRNKALLDSLKTELESNTSYLPNIIGSLISIYLLKINDRNVQLINSTDNRSLDYFNQFRVLLEKNFIKTRDANIYASELSISYKLLNEVCKEVVKNTAKSFIDSYVILESKRMLVTSSFSIKEIAYNMGFDELTNFTKFFKKHTLETPSKFRKM